MWVWACVGVDKDLIEKEADRLTQLIYPDSVLDDNLWKIGNMLQVRGRRSAGPSH